MADDRRSLLDFIRDSRLLAYGIGAISTAVGLFLLVGPERSANVIAITAGVIIAFIGLTEVLDALGQRRRHTGSGLLFLQGLADVATGAVLVFWPGITLDVLVWVLGVGLVAGGVVGFLAARQLPKEAGRSSVVARSFIGIAFGVVLMAWPGRTVTVVIVIIGIQLVLFGAYLLFAGWRLSRLAAAVEDAASDRNES